jgi:hypothetical protein
MNSSSNNMFQSDLINDPCYQQYLNCLKMKNLKNINLNFNSQNNFHNNINSRLCQQMSNIKQNNLSNSNTNISLNNTAASFNFSNSNGFNCNKTNFYQNQIKKNLSSNNLFFSHNNNINKLTYERDEIGNQ